MFTSDDAMEAGRKWMNDTLRKCEEATAQIQAIVGVSRDNILGIEVSVNYEGETVSVRVPQAVFKNSPESISRSIVANHKIAKLEVAKQMFETASSVFPGVAEVRTLISGISEAEADTQTELDEANRWKPAPQAPSYDDDDDDDGGWNQPILRS